MLFPGCRRPATHCDLNHLQAATNGGDTSQLNLGPGCRHHHPMSDGVDPKWQVSQPEPGIYQITSPTGRKYRSHPQPLLEPADDPPDKDHDPPPPF